MCDSISPPTAVHMPRIRMRTENAELHTRVRTVGAASQSSPPGLEYVPISPGNCVHYIFLSALDAVPERILPLWSNHELVP